MKIITHDGMFHADEIFAIALLHQVLGECPVERKRNISAEELQDPDIWVLDVGRTHDAELHNFDHHQDRILKATNTMVRDALLDEAKISSNQYLEIYDVFEAISEIDRNGYAGVNGFQVNSLIRSFNYLKNGFDLAVEVARNYIRACFNTVDQEKDSRRIYDAGIVHLDGMIRECTGYPIHWKRYNDARILVFQDKTRWKVISIDSTRYPLLSTEKEEFLHDQKFMATFLKREEALECAILSYATYEYNEDLKDNVEPIR